MQILIIETKSFLEIILSYNPSLFLYSAFPNSCQHTMHMFISNTTIILPPGCFCLPYTVHTYYNYSHVCKDT